MAIETPQAIKFSNEKIRVAADLMAQLNNFATAVVDEWYAVGGASLFPNDAEEIISDNAINDGRTVITGADANNIITRLIEFRDSMSADGNAKLNTVLKPAVNTTR